MMNAILKMPLIEFSTAAFFREIFRVGLFSSLYQKKIIHSKISYPKKTQLYDQSVNKKNFNPSRSLFFKNPGMKKNNLKSWERIILFACSAALLSVLIFPIWQIQLNAPQYPEGLVLLIY